MPTNRSGSDRCSSESVHPEAIRRASAHMPDDESLIDLAELFKVFGDSTRVKILWALDLEELCVCDIAALLQMTQSAISHQLRILRQASLVKYRRSGKTVYYSLDDDHVRQILDQGTVHLREP